ncbi:MAG: putative secreted protein, SAP67-like [Rapeseed phyllody phytoplasma]|uniref:Putative secreted protein, SAP67-like n=2 Tax=16SrI (Aster yellows group) TaxID=3042590 RepID=A0A859IA66_9MOLU|nr:MAG: putative secreted protein, SAP67-like [Rapeseed phyllody phytoplasma]
MFKLQNQFKIINICLLVFLGLLFINNNYQVMAMGNKNSSNNSEISNDKEYALYVKAELAIQSELTILKLNNEKKSELSHKQKCITTEINKYNKRKNNNRLSEQPESSRQNISSAINDDENELSDDELQPMNLMKRNYKCPIDKSESSKKNDYKK